MIEVKEEAKGRIEQEKINKEYFDEEDEVAATETDAKTTAEVIQKKKQIQDIKAEAADRRRTEAERATDIENEEETEGETEAETARDTETATTNTEEAETATEGAKETESLWQKKRQKICIILYKKKIYIKKRIYTKYIYKKII